jgi:hypothetical protein
MTAALPARRRSNETSFDRHRDRSNPKKAGGRRRAMAIVVKASDVMVAVDD